MTPLSYFSVFGKTMEDVREHRIVNLVRDPQALERAAKQPTYRLHRNIHENLVSIERWRDTVLLDKPIYIGASVLELSKLHMLNFHYDYIKEKYPGNKSILGFSDTDSLLYKIETEDIYRDMREDIEHFDVSNYPDDHRIFERDVINAPGTPEHGMPDLAKIKELKEMNQKVVGKWKDESAGEAILEFVGLRSKAYAYRLARWHRIDATWKEKEKKKCKGIKRGVVARTMTFQHYYDVLTTHIPLYMNQVRFRSHEHHVQTVEQRKVALSCYDDKRFILSDGIHSRAHGHWRDRNF